MRWHQLPDMPPINHQTGYNCHRQMQVWRGQAYLFDGSKRLWQLDCESETWRMIDTAFHGTWPYPKHRLSQFCTAIVDGTLYIFSGDDAVTRLGCNVFMSLPLPAPGVVPMREKPVWTHLGGTSANVPCVRTPNLRTLATMWAVPAQRRLYVLGGNANRAAAHQKRLPGGNAEDFTYEDFWSFDCVGRTWTRERWRGSYPSPRTEMAGAWNGKLGAGGRGIVYGGYNASLQSAMPMDNGQDGVCGFTFFGDSFLFDPETKLWEHVIAKGFPSYRAQASMAVDEDTGFTYLYGGKHTTPFAQKYHVLTDHWSRILRLRQYRLCAYEGAHDALLQRRLATAPRDARRCHDGRRPPNRRAHGDNGALETLLHLRRRRLRLQKMLGHMWWAVFLLLSDVPAHRME